MGRKKTMTRAEFRAFQIDKTKAAILENPGLIKAQVMKLTGCSEDVLVAARRELVEEGAIVRVCNRGYVLTGRKSVSARDVRRNQKNEMLENVKSAILADTSLKTADLMEKFKCRPCVIHRARFELVEGGKLVKAGNRYIRAWDREKIISDLMCDPSQSIAKIGSRYNMGRAIPQQIRQDLVAKGKLIRFNALTHMTAD